MAIKDYIQNANLKFNGQPKRRATTKGIVLHHAAVQQATPQQIHQWHLARGWIGAGYNVYIRKDGSVWELRPLWAIGAHAEGVNDESIGVCVEGLYHPSGTSYDKEMPKPQYDALVRVVKDLLQEYPSIEWIKGHREVPGSVTACPGDYFPLQQIKNLIGGGNMILKVGSRGDEVRQLQENLNKLGFNCGAADGIFGPKTEAAVKAFQQAHGLTVDGIAGPQTLAKIEELLNKPTNDAEIKRLKERIKELELAVQNANTKVIIAERTAQEVENKLKRYEEFFRTFREFLGGV